MPYYIAVLIDNQPTGPVLAISENQADILELWRPGFSALCWSIPAKPIRKISPEALARVRALRHNRRVERDVPLFAPLFAVPVPEKAKPSG